VQMNATVIGKGGNVGLSLPEPTDVGPTAPEHHGGAGWFAALVALLLDVGRGCAVEPTGPDLAGGGAHPAAPAERLPAPGVTLVTEPGAGPALALDSLPEPTGAGPSAPEHHAGAGWSAALVALLLDVGRGCAVEPTGDDLAGGGAHPAAPAERLPAPGETLVTEPGAGPALPLDPSHNAGALPGSSPSPAPHEGMHLPPPRSREAVGEEGPLPGNLLLSARADKPPGPVPATAGEQSSAAEQAASIPPTSPEPAIPSNRTVGREPGNQPGGASPVGGHRGLTAAADEAPGPAETGPIARFDPAGVRPLDATDPAGPRPPAESPPPAREVLVGEAWAALRARVTELDPQRQSIRVAMDPEGLGAMLLEVSLTAEGARASFEVADPAAGQALAERQADLRQALQGVGVRLSSVDVRLGDSAGKRDSTTSAPDDPPPAAPDIRPPAKRLPTGAGDLSHRSLLDYRV